jgi:hypothetical protein
MTSRLFAMFPTRRVLVAMLFVGTLGGCKITEQGPSPRELLELAHRHNQWVRLNIHDYEFDYDRQSFLHIPPVRVQVFDDTVYRVVNRTTGATLSNLSSFPTIEGLFTTAAQALGDENHASRVEYDEHYGFPTLIDAPSPTPAGGFSVTVTNFRPPVIALARVRR